VVQVADQTQIPAALAHLGVTPAVRYDMSTLMNVHRVDGATDFYYLANARHAENRVLVPIDQIAWLTPTSPGAVPFRLDAWTGQVTPIPQFLRADGRVGVRVALNPGESTIVGLAEPGWAGEPASVQVVATDADSVRLDGRLVIVRATQAGTYTTTLANGTVLKATIATVPSPIDLPAWTLAAEDWQPGPTATQTVKPVVTVSLDALMPWSSIPALADASGIGRYTTTVTLPQTWAAGVGATLDLGTVNDTFRVWANGQRVPPAGILNSRADVGNLMRPGVNAIEVEVATTLINRLRTVTPAIYGVATRQAYGLLGPVRLLPYAEAAAR